MTTTPSSPNLSSKLNSRIDGSDLELKLFHVYNEEVKMCDIQGQSTQHIGDEWMRREIRRICGFNVSDRWLKTFRRRHGIRYFSGRRHADKVNELIPLAALDSTKGKMSNFLKERRILRTSRKEYDDVDVKVYAEINRRQTQRERLTNPWIREYAQYIASQLHPQIPDIEKFFDANWLYRFKRRYNVELKPRCLEEFEKYSQPIITMNVEDDKMKPSAKPEFYNQEFLQRYLNFLSQTNSGLSRDPLTN